MYNNSLHKDCNEKSSYNKFQYQSNVSDRILFFTSLVPALILISFVSSFHVFAVKYLHDLRPYLVVLTFGEERIKSCRRLYLVELKVITIIAGGALSDILLFIVNSMSWILRVSMDGSLILCKRS